MNSFYRLTIFQFPIITKINYLHSFICFAGNAFSLDALAKRLAADSKITWSPNFNNNPMLMAQIQAGLIANEMKHQQQNVVEKPEPNAYYRTMVHRSYDGYN